MVDESMSVRGAHYTALLELVQRQGAAKLHDRERQQLLDAADALLFGEEEREEALRNAETLIDGLETSERWTSEACDLAREHLYGCDAPAPVRA